MWHDLLHLDVPAPEKVIRTIAVYAAIAILLRLAGKRELAQLNSLDFVVVLLISNVVQNAVIGADESLVGGLLGAAVLVAVDSAAVRLSTVVSARMPRLARVLEGGPTVLVRDGAMNARALTRLGLRKGDVLAAMRKQGADRIADVKEMVVMPGGSLLVRLRSEEESANRADVAALKAQIAALQASIDTLAGRIERPR
jgi:uncharacterized membrane protein YcaP (DUF421 family)